MTTTVRRIELGVLIALLALGIFVVWRATQMPAGTVSLPGPGMAPTTLGLLLVLSATALLFLHVRSRREQAAPVLLGNRQVVVASLALLAAGLIFEPLGFVLTGTLFLFVMVWMLSPLGWWRSLVAAAVAASSAKFLFGNLLDVQLPPLPWAN